MDNIETEEDLESVIKSITFDDAPFEQQLTMNSVITGGNFEEPVITIAAENAPIEQIQSQQSTPAADLPPIIHEYDQKISYSICSICLNPTNCDGSDDENTSSGNIYFLCSRKEDIKNARQSAYDGLELQAKRMKITSTITHPKLKIGSTVRIPVPDGDRGKGDSQSVLAVVLETTEHRFYRLGTKQGVLSKCYSRSEFSTCPANILTIEEVSKDKDVPLRSAATGQSVGHGQGFKKCAIRLYAD
ncbi:hypothetical protein HUJ04_008257 [Dendroctonus ponderosae]|nr:hypothetical protein HUJ04_008257 [Dendroctonus ponderosae]